jgi:hypothetical protein
VITFPQYAIDLKSIPITAEDLLPYEDITISRKPIEGAYNILWGGNMETGFFWDAMHIDTLGLYKNSSFNTPQGIAEVDKFDKDVTDKLLSTKIPSKYRQTNYDVDWRGVTLACQNPNDRSVLSVGTADDWWKFYEGACKFYGKNLFVKLHPWNSGEIGERICRIAKENGCRAEKTNHSCITNAEFVLVYNSSFAVDCFLRDVAVAQFAPGYFYKTPAVTYTDRQYPTKVKKNDWAKKLVSFLACRYCFNMQMPVDKWVNLLRHFAESKELFPLTDEWSYINGNSHY